MVKICRYCHFQNPQDANECLSCGKKLPKGPAEIKESLDTLTDLFQGRFSQAGKKMVGSAIKDQTGDLKYQFNPAWQMKVKVHRFKRGLRSFFWFLGIVLILIVIGFIVSFFRKIFGK